MEKDWKEVTWMFQDQTPSGNRGTTREQPSEWAGGDSCGEYHTTGCPTTLDT